MTTRGMGADEFTEIANIIADCLINPEDEAVKQDCRRRVASLCDRFPLYPHLRAPEPALALTIIVGGHGDDAVPPRKLVQFARNPVSSWVS
jgi:hypothetical protein